tara:strand:- start:379 stop:2307 length:1929 start_codon:yes stop_codon:yes gene_type:complete
MADDNNLNSELALQGLAQINLSIKQLNDNLKSKDTLNTVGNLRKAIREENLSSEDEQKLQSKQGLMDLGFEQQDAELRVAANTELTRLKAELQRLQDIEEQFGGLAPKDTTLKEQLEFDIDRMLEIQKFGRELGKIEKGLKPAFAKITATIKESGDKTFTQIGKEGFSDLRGDIDKVTAFLGPAATAFQNLPFLGTIAKFSGKLLAKAAATLFQTILGRKKGEKQHKEIVKLEKKKQKFTKKQLQEENRRRVKEGKVPLKRDGTKDKRFKQQEGEEEGTGLFGAAAGVAALGKSTAFFNPVTMALFVKASALAAVGLNLLGVGMVGFLSLVGIGMGVVIFQLMNAMSRGIASFDENGATDALGRLEHIDLLKVAGGLAALAGTSVLNSIAGLIALLPGDEAPYTKLGEDAAGFANAVKDSGFMDIDTAAFGEKTSALFGPSVKNSFAGVLDFFKGDATPLTDLGADAAGFADAVKPFEEMDVDTFTTNITKVKNAMADFELPENKDGLLKSLFGESGIDQLKELASITFTDDQLGSKLEKLGVGVNMISDGLENLTNEKAQTLGRLGFEIGKNFDNFNLNFGMVPQTAGAGADMTIAQGEQASNTAIINQAVANTNNNQTTRKVFNATGSKPNHSRAHQSLP